MTRLLGKALFERSPRAKGPSHVLIRVRGAEGGQRGTVVVSTYFDLLRWGLKTEYRPFLV